MEPDGQRELALLCGTVREMASRGDYAAGERLVRDAMGVYPHAPQPHNLIGVLLELQGDHPAAMKHFRAAWALDPAYYPARWNICRFGSFFPSGEWAFDEADCPVPHERQYHEPEQDARGAD